MTQTFSTSRSRSTITLHRYVKDMQTYSKVMGNKGSPVGRVPPEILEEIFLHCLPNECHVRPHLAKAPLLLTQVCSAWRNAAIYTPKLWTSLAIYLSADNAQRRIPLLQMWLERSSQHRVALFAYVPSACDWGLQGFVDILNTNLHKFQFLRLTLPHKSRLQILEVLERGLPSLESLEIRFSLAEPDNCTPIAHDVLPITACSAPKLRSLTWNSPGTRRITFSPQQATITHLDVGYCTSLPDCIRILAECPKIVECQFKHICEHPNPYPIDPALLNPVTLPALESISFQSLQPISPLLDILTLPSLHTFKVYDLSAETLGDAIWSQASFLQLVERSGCSIQHLHLLNALFSDEELIECLEYTSSSLTELRLLNLKGTAVFTNRVIQNLTIPEDAADPGITVLCPKLETIRFGRSLCSTDGYLANMVESRWRTPRPDVVRLKSINPKLCEPQHKQDIAKLIELGEEGLEIM